jgi:hypothetical protein
MPKLPPTPEVLPVIPRRKPEIKPRDLLEELKSEK